MNDQGRLLKLGAFSMLCMLLLMAFAPLKTRPVKYVDRSGNSLTIFPNCKDNGFSFTLTGASEECSETISGDVKAGKDQRYASGELVLIFHRRINAVEITEEGNYTYGASCGQFSGTYQKIGYE